MNVDKPKHTVFYKSLDDNNLRLRLPVLSTNNYNCQMSPSIKFLGVIIDGNLSWKDHINIVENKVSKDLGWLYKTKDYLITRNDFSLLFICA